MKRVLIANRGEIAVRIIRTLKDLGIESVAVYSDADEHSLHRSLADYAIRLPGNASADTYLNIALLKKAICASKAEGVHPGYGFLSESPVFSREVASLGVKFIGPSEQAMSLTGDKIEARKLMQAHDVPVVPGCQKELSGYLELKDMAGQIGFPLILKAAFGGGGRGMRTVRDFSTLEDSFLACQREAKAYFGNPSVFCERYVENPRHIEIQVLCDAFGNGVYLFERDCSIQRRHQKLLEEAPSIFLSKNMQKNLGEIAVRAAKAAKYEGAGTVEFICDSPENAYFMEMNTRIQVEHPVTEAITGKDLIAEQIKVAMGLPLQFSQEDLQVNGYAIEVRINAEDASKGFLPAPGKVTKLRLPSGPFIRVDSHLYEGYEIPAFYDSMVAKIISWGQSREEARKRMLRALQDMEISGVPTTARFQEVLLNHPDFIAGKFTTHFLANEEDYFQKNYRVPFLEQPMEHKVWAALSAQLAMEQKNLKIPNTLDRSLWSSHGMVN